MRIIPAIDIIDGKCVRLTKGDYSTQIIYNEDFKVCFHYCNGDMVGIAPKGGLNSRATIPACQFIENDSHGYFGPGEESGVDAVFIKAEDFIQADAGGQVITIAVQVKYFDAFECHRTYKACLGITFTVDPAMLRQKPITEGRLFSSIVIGPDNGGD